MLAILSAILGFAGPFLPELLKFFNRKADNAHELAMMEMRLRAGAAEHTWRMEEINAQADIAEVQELHKPQQSFGVQVLDKAHESGWSQWIIVPVFYLFAALDFINGIIRPGVTSLVVGGYVAYKAALYHTLTSNRFGNDWAGAVQQLWTPDDYALVLYCLAYYFGDRTRKAIFGGNAANGYAGK